MNKVIMLLAAFWVLLGSCRNSATTNADNKKVDVADIKLRMAEKDYTLVYFWTTWCGPCRRAFKETLPQVEQSIDETKAQLITIAVSKDDQKIAEISKAGGLKAKSLKLDFIGPDVYLNHKIVLQNTLENLFQDQKVWTNSVPVFVLVDKSGKVIDAKLPKEVVQLMALLDEKGIAKHQTASVLH